MPGVWCLLPVVDGRDRLPAPACARSALPAAPLVGAGACCALPHGHNAWARPSDKVLVGPLLGTLGVTSTCRSTCFGGRSTPVARGAPLAQLGQHLYWQHLEARVTSATWRGSTSIGSTSRRVRPLPHGGAALSWQHVEAHETSGTWGGGGAGTSWFGRAGAWPATPRLA